ncbi:MAG: type IV pilus biogenesis protein PilM [bacterium]
MPKLKGEVAKRTLGIVISDREIIVVEGKRSGKKFYLLKAARELIGDKGIVENGRIVSESACILKLRELIDQIKPEAVFASVNIPANLVLLKTIPLDPDIIERFPDWMEWEKEKHSVDASIKSELSYLPIGAKTSDGELYLMASVRKDIIIERKRVIEGLGLTLIAADPDPVAAYNGFIASCREDDESNYLFIDISLPFYTFFATFNGKFVYGGTKVTSVDYHGIERGNPPQVLFDSLAREIHQSALEFFAPYGDFPQNATGIILIGYFAPSETLKNTLGNFFLPPILNTIPYDKKRLKFKVGKDFGNVWGAYIKGCGLALRSINE